MASSSLSRAGRCFQVLGLVGFYWFFLTSFWGPDGYHLASLILLGWLMYWAGKHYRALFSSSLVWLAVATSAYIVIRSAIGYWNDPASLEWQVKHGMGLIKATGLYAILVVPWLVEPLRHRRMSAAFGLVFVSIVIQAWLYFFVHPDPGEAPRLTDGRLGLQMGPNSLGVIFAMVLLGAVVTIAYLLRRISPTRKYLTPLLVSVLILGMVVPAIIGLILTQSRASWLAAAVVVPCVLAVLAVRLLREGSSAVRRVTAMFLIAFLAVGVLASNAYWDRIENKLQSERDQIARLATLDFSNLETSSVGARIRMWRMGLEAAAERPVVGWSPGETKRLVAERTQFGYEHVHSTPLQIVVSLGLPGLLLVAAIVVVSVCEVYRRLSRGEIPFELGLLWFGSLAIMLISTVFDFQSHDREFQSLAVVLAVLPLAAQVDRRLRAGDVPLRRLPDDLAMRGEPAGGTVICAMGRGRETAVDSARRDNF